MPLSDQQMKYLAIAFTCLDSEPKIDYDKFHRIAGLASANSAREMLRVTKKKLREEYGALGCDGAAANDNKNKSTPRKGAIVGSTGSAGTSGGKGKNGTPGTRKGAKRGRKGGVGLGDVEDDDEEMMTMFGGGSPTKKAKVEKGVRVDGEGVKGAVGQGKANGIKTEPLSSTASFGGANGHTLGGDGIDGMGDEEFLVEPFWNVG